MIVRSLVVLLSFMLVTNVKPIEAFQKFCYYDSTASLRPGLGQVLPAALPTSLCTMITYRYFGLSPTGAAMSLNSAIDAEQFAAFTALKATNPSVKFLVSIGGPHVSSTTFSEVVTYYRQTAVTNITNFIAANGLDGVDIQWEYPTIFGGRESDRYNFVAFLKLLRETFDPLGLTLVVTTGANQYLMEHSYDLPRISYYADYINPTTFLYHKGNEAATAQNSPLFPGVIVSNPNDNVNATITNFLNNGVPKRKLNLGIAFFGISFHLENPLLHSTGAPTVGYGIAGPYLQTEGKLSYLEICSRFKNKPTWITKFNLKQGNPFAYKDSQWIGYDNVRSVTLKAEYAILKGLAGVSVSTIDMDDVTNYCGDGTYPLLNAIKSILC